MDKSKYVGYPYEVYKLDLGYIKEEFKKYNYELIKKEDNRYGDDITNITNFIVKTEEGYLLPMSIHHLGKKKGMTGIVHQSNPYLLDNIIQWLKNNDKPFKLVKKKYFNSHHYFHVNDVLEWKCNNNKKHTWKETWKNIKNGYTCPFCNGEQILDKEKSLGFLNTEITKELHKTKNYHNPMQIPPDSKIALWWECPECSNIYKKTVYQRVIKKSGCAVCSGKTTSIDKNNIGVTYPHLVRYWHKYRNVISPYEVKLGEDLVVWWKCPQNGGKCGHVWKQKLSEAIRRFKVKDKSYFGGKHYCPYCYKETSKKVVDKNKEIGLNSYISNWLKKNNINHKREVKIGAVSPKGAEMPYDIGVYDEHDNLVFLIEYQGEQHTNFIKAWHITKEGFEYQKEKDKIKSKYCYEAGIPLVIIHYYEAKDINNILKQSINKYL